MTEPTQKSLREPTDQELRAAYVVLNGREPPADPRLFKGLVYGDVQIKRVALALDAARQERREWQDISTAPKDGTRILAVVGPDDVETVFWSESTWADGGGWVNDINRSDTIIFQPTHWVPLPAPPSRPQP